MTNDSRTFMVSGDDITLRGTYLGRDEKGRKVPMDFTVKAEGATTVVFTAHEVPRLKRRRR